MFWKVTFESDSSLGGYFSVLPAFEHILRLFISNIEKQSQDYVNALKHLPETQYSAPVCERNGEKLVTNC